MEFDDFLRAFERDRWAAQVILRGRLPVVPSRDALPAVSHDFDGTLLNLLGTPSKLYWGAVNAGGDPVWVEVASG